MNAGMVGLIHRVLDCVELMSRPPRVSDRLTSSTNSLRTLRRQTRWLRVAVRPMGTRNRCLPLRGGV